MKIINSIRNILDENADKISRKRRKKKRLKYAIESHARSCEDIQESCGNHTEIANVIQFPKRGRDGHRKS